MQKFNFFFFFFFFLLVRFCFNVKLKWEYISNNEPYKMTNYGLFNCSRVINQPLIACLKVEISSLCTS
jgi:hypothetical protein